MKATAGGAAVLANANTEYTTASEMYPDPLNPGTYPAEDGSMAELRMTCCTLPTVWNAAKTSRNARPSRNTFTFFVLPMSILDSLEFGLGFDSNKEDSNFEKFEVRKLRNLDFFDFVSFFFVFVRGRGVSSQKVSVS